VGLLEPRGRPAEIHDRQRAVSGIKIQNGGLETVRRFFLRGSFSYAEGVTEISPGLEQRDYPGLSPKKLFPTLKGAANPQNSVHSK
jgi:hypothetical protein